jgi:hypothetical protein
VGASRGVEKKRAPLDNEAAFRQDRAALVAAALCGKRADPPGKLRMMTSNTLFRWCFGSVALASLSVGACGGGDDAAGASSGAGNSGSGGTAGTSKGGTTSRGGTTSKGGTSGASVNGEGVCQPTCAKACVGDNDCETSQGELCCDFGEAGKICLSAAQCPRHCEDDSACSTSQGEACLPTSLSAPNECVDSRSGLRSCGGDGDCYSSEVCCTIYDQPICLPPGACPQACSESSECNTGNGESCCTSVRAVEPDLVAEGLCLNPSYTECPKACDTSSDCATASGELCCDGLCAFSCPKACKQSSDCTSPDARICCTSASARLPQPTRFFSAGPRCTGVAESCATLGSRNAGYCTPVTGCTPSADLCTGTPYVCAFSDQNQTECQARPGCEYDEKTGNCDGTPDPCSGISTSTECYANSGCLWGMSGACTGTATPCDLIPATQCASNPGCHVDSRF